MGRTALASLVASTCLLSLAACDGDEPVPPSATRAPTASTSPSTTSSSSPTASSRPNASPVPPYLAEYSGGERKAYEEAVASYERFSTRNAELFRKGRATPAAKAFYKRSTAAWQSYWARLRDFEARGLRVIGRGEVLGVRPAAIRLDQDGGGQVVLRVCSVATGVRVLQDGQPVPQPSPKPTITRVAIVQLPGESSWRVLADRVGGPC